jgi:CheY-like chemotaxis protein
MAKKLYFETVPLADVIVKNKLSPDTTGKTSPVVLVVDDEQVIADTLVAILSRSGYMAIAAYDGASALETAGVIPPQMVITDVCMPGMTGIELAITLRELVPDCKVLLFSGQASTADLLAAARSAGHEFAALTKPIHPTELLAHVSECLGSSITETGESWSFLRRAQREARSA